MPAVRRVPIPALLLALIGVAGTGIAIYLTSVHYAGTPLVCSANGVVNCERVLTSRYSTVLGIPWSVGGIVWFAALAISGVLALRAPEPHWLHPAQLFWGLIGLGTALYLIGVEVLALGVLCLWCTVEHVLIAAALALILLRTPRLAVADLPEAARDRRRIAGARR
jgi:uncharacterized membrane protein